MRQETYAAGIRFNDCYFSEPVRLIEWTPPKCGGLFAVLVPDPNWAPKPFRPIYFGEFGNNTPDPAPEAAQGQFRDGVERAALLVVVLPLPFSTTAQRQALRNELVSAYHPACQGEEATNLRAALNRLSASTSEARRRSIGFLPWPEPVA
jgi:hypothetical protein